jgi:hypothetical protein
MTRNLKIETKQLVHTQRGNGKYFEKPENSFKRAIAQVFSETAEAK